MSTLPTDSHTSFLELLRSASQRLFESNPDKMASGALLPTKNVIDPDDCDLFFLGVSKGLIELKPDGRFNTLDRPTPHGRWALLSRSRSGGWYDAEYLPQAAAYVDLILNRGFDSNRVLFELPARSLQLDLAVFDNDHRVLILGEAKKDAPFLSKLASRAVERFAFEMPGLETKKSGDEIRQLAWRLWVTRAPYLWLIGPGTRLTFRCSYDPLRLDLIDDLPTVNELDLPNIFTGMMDPPNLLAVEG